MDNERKHEEKKEGEACTPFTGSHLDEIKDISHLLSIADKVDIIICAVDLIKALNAGLINIDEYEKFIQMVKSSDEEIRNLVKTILKEKNNGNI